MKIVLALCKFIFVALLTRVVLTAIIGSNDGFNTQKLYRVIVETKEQLEVLKGIEEQYENGIIFWSPVIDVDIPIDVMISSEMEDDMLSILEKEDIFYEILTTDDDRHSRVVRSLQVDKVRGSMNWTAYQRLDTIYDWLDELAKTYSDHVKIVVIGHSYEGRPIKGIKITFNKNNPGIFFEGGSHAREWISPAVVTYLTNEILTSKNKTFNKFARSLNWFIFPVVNPDGYEYSHTTDRMWRKTRRPYANDCYGADPNRNWDFQWLANDGASTNSCDDAYAGPNPFSEVEVKSLADYIASVANKFYVYLSMHSYAQQILFPWDYTTEHANNYDEMMYAGTKSAEALARRYGTNFSVGQTAEISYYDCGDSIDYVKAVHDTPFVYYYELRDTGDYGFELPKRQIIPSSLEFIDALVALVGATKELGYRRA